MNDRFDQGASDCGISSNWVKFGFYLTPNGSTGLKISANPSNLSSNLD